MQPGGEGPQDPAGRADWASTAGDGSPALPTASPNMPDAEHAPGAAPQVSQQPQQPQTVPVPVTSLKRTGLLGVLDNVSDALVGRTRPELGKDPDGNMYIKEHTLTRGEQWRRIAGEAMAGAAAGLKAGRGHGAGAAGVAGIQAGQQIQDREKQNLNDDVDQENKIVLSNANRQMLRMNLAQETWKATRNKIEATQHDIEFSDKQEDRLTKEGGGKVLGTVENPGDISKVLKINPDLAADMVKNHLLELVPHYNEDGSRGGFKVIKMPIGYREQVLPPGATFHTFDPVSGQLVEHKSSDAMTAGDRDDYDTSATLAQTKFMNDKREQELKHAQAQEALGHATEVPSIIEEHQTKSALNRAEAGKVPSDIEKNKGQAAKANADAKKAAEETGDTPEGQATIDAIGTGRAPMKNLSYLLARNPALFNQVAKKYPDFDGSKVDGYVKMYQAYTSGKAADALNAGSTALRHMQELQALNTVWSHIPGTPAYNRYENKADTLAHELAKFYGNNTIPAIEGIKKTLTATAPGNRNAAIQEQAKSMGDKFDEFEDQWNRGVPSAAYRPLMPQLSEASKQARAALDPRYKDRLVAEEQKKAAAAQAAPPQQPKIIGEPEIPTPLAPARPNAPAANQSHAFSVGAWLRANPNGDAAAAKAAAQAQGIPVID
jgi:hypothetical protein